MPRTSKAHETIRIRPPIISGFSLPSRVALRSRCPFRGFGVACAVSYVAGAMYGHHFHVWIVNKVQGHVHSYSLYVVHSHFWTNWPVKIMWLRQPEHRICAPLFTYPIPHLISVHRVLSENTRIRQPRASRGSLLVEQAELQPKTACAI